MTSADVRLLRMVLYVAEGEAGFFARVERALAPQGVTLHRIDRLPARRVSTEAEPVVALVSVSALAEERSWYGQIDVPVIWVGNERYDRQTMDPLGGGRLLSLDFTEAELRAMLLSVLQPGGGELPALASGTQVVAKSESMTSLLDEVMAFAGSDHNVLIQGETGTGKELIAELLHQAHSRYSRGPFVAVNCGAIPDGLFESLFFGHTKGSFTGAVKDHKGYLEQASGGTLFMDEVGELPLFQQVKLLRVLESGILTRVGSEVPIQPDFRLVAATNRNLRELVRKDEFRADLFYRLAVIELAVPNLDERGAADKIAIFRMMVSRMLDTVPGDEATAIPEWLTDRVAGIHFAGNVRQLRNLAERVGVIVGQTGQWDARLINRALDLVQDVGQSQPQQARQQPASGEHARIVNALKENSWLRQPTADQLGMSRKTLWEKMRKYGIKE